MITFGLSLFQALLLYPYFADTAKAEDQMYDYGVNPMLSSCYSIEDPKACSLLGYDLTNDNVDFLFRVYGVASALLLTSAVKQWKRKEGMKGRGERPAGRAELLANGPYWAGPPLSASRCRPLAVGPSLTVWYFSWCSCILEKSRKPWSILGKKNQHNASKICENLSKISKQFSNF